ncbi:MAG: hypothetical protein M0P91_05770 [Sulfuricurvum sp.]|jgi:hypothetical protein|uniref:hypothetical protein n=1 Tax=Sulfuricurvum sp. TaxID=2025608 RepID=UPI0025D1FB25|nr:hypothetical protein [Sulfuricurvum sp.]MCK9372686.1 hypothetical protein [Sulfuricurvum sp.]
MKIIILSLCAVSLLYGSGSNDSYVILNEVAKLRQKYEECRSGQCQITGIAPAVHQKCDKERRDAIRKIAEQQNTIAQLEKQIHAMKARRVDLKELKGAETPPAAVKIKTPPPSAKKLPLPPPKLCKVEQTATSSEKNHPVATNESERERLKRLLELERKNHPAEKPFTPPKKFAATDKTPAAYRMKIDGMIYDAPEGKPLFTWESQRSFTSGVKSGEWIKITGYFVNRKWQATRENENLWVKESDVIRR